MDPIGKMMMDAVTAPYHEEEYAIRALLGNRKIEYVPAPTSEIQPIKIVYGTTDKPFAPYLVVSKEEPITIMNPFQFMPYKIKNNFISFRDKRVSTTETNRMVKLTGIWQTPIVGPLEGKPYEKEVPLFIDTMTRNFYTYTPDSQLIPYPILQEPTTEAFVYLHKYINAFRDNQELEKPIYISMVQQIMKSVNLPDLPWYQIRRYSGYNPINWNPLSKNLSDILGTYDWGDYVLDSPTQLYLETQKDKLSEEEYSLQEKWSEAAFQFREFLDEWIDESLGEWFDRDGDGWGMSQGWDTALGFHILSVAFNEETLLQRPIQDMIDCVIGIDLSRMENSSTRQFLIDNKKQLDAFMNTNIMVWLFALQMPRECEDYILEWLNDYEE